MKKKDDKNRFIDWVVIPFDNFSEKLKVKTSLNSQDWIIAILTLIGFYIVIFLFRHRELNLSESFSSVVILATFMAILWNTKETYWLKIVQQKTLDHQRVKDDVDVMPYLDCHLSYTQEGFLCITNKGRGLAKNINFSVSFGGKVFEKGPISLPTGGDFTPDDLDDHDFLVDFGSTDSKLLDQVDIIGSYQDIFSRNYHFEYNFVYKNNVFYILGTIQFPEGWKIGNGV